MVSQRYQHWYLITEKVLDKSDFNGEYVIDRSFFPGSQADWQYNHFRFKITENNTIYFYKTDGEEIVETYAGRISSPGNYHSARLAIHMMKPTHHVVESHPTIYREAWGFYLVFKSSHYQNMFFRKGEWKEIKN